MTQGIQEGLNHLFDQISPLAKSFSKKTYDAKFEEMYKEFEPLMNEILAECEKSQNQSVVIEETARVLPDRIHAILNRENSMRKKEMVLLDYNLGMAAFVIPMFRYKKCETSEQIVDRMVELWNDNGTSMDIAKSTFEEIQAGFKSRMCYITTAVCKSLGKTDECYELKLMRDYRDEYLVCQKGGEAIIREYYDIAPTIVKRIDRMNNAGEVYLEIWERYLYPCVSLLEAGKKEECREVYTNMVHSLQKKYMYS